jgi:hypothetical protein
MTELQGQSGWFALSGVSIPDLFSINKARLRFEPLSRTRKINMETDERIRHFLTAGTAQQRWQSIPLFILD